MYYIKLLAITEVFKNWHYHLKNCKNKFLLMTNYNSLYYFINIKNLSFTRSTGPKNYFITNFILIIDRIRLIKLLILYLAIFNRAKVEKKFFKLRI